MEIQNIYDDGIALRLQTQDKCNNLTLSTTVIYSDSHTLITDVSGECKIYMIYIYYINLHDKLTILLNYNFKIY